MRIDCGECGAQDKVWCATWPGSTSLMGNTLETGVNTVECRACKARGFADLKVICANTSCKSTNLWRWPNRSMGTNCRRWMCRDCGEVTTSLRVAHLYTKNPPTPAQHSGGQTLPLCRYCGQGTLKIDARDYMESALCFNTLCSRRNAFKVHKADGRYQRTAGAEVTVKTVADEDVWVLDDEAVLE